MLILQHLELQLGVYIPNGSQMECNQFSSDFEVLLEPRNHKNWLPRGTAQNTTDRQIGRQIEILARTSSLFNKALLEERSY